MLSASVMKMIKKSESIREKGSTKKKRVHSKYKRSLTEEITSSDGGDLDPETQVPVHTERKTSHCKVEPDNAKSKLDMLHKRFSNITISAETNITQVIDPEVACELLKNSLIVKPLKLTVLQAEKPDGYCRFVCISDTYSKESMCNVPDGDVLIVAGNFTTCGHPDEIRAFNDYLGTLPHKHKIVVPGEKEVTLDATWLSRCKAQGSVCRRSRSVHALREDSLRQAIRRAMLTKRISTTHDLLTNCTLLSDSEIEINGIRIYGTPWQPFLKDMAFNISDSKKLIEKWLRIPDGIHVLITHTPPLAHGDLNESGIRCGCAELLQAVVNRVKPKFHVYGQAVGGHGCYTNDVTLFINCCICDSEFNPQNQPIIFDFNLRDVTSEASACTSENMEPSKIENILYKAGGLHGSSNARV